MLASRCGSLLGVHIVTFATLARRAIEHSFRVPPRQLPSAALESLLASALEELIESSADDRAARIAAYPGALRGALGTCRELRDAGISPEALRALPASAGTHPLLADLQARFEARIARVAPSASDPDEPGWSDEAGIARTALPAIAPYLAGKQIARAYFYGVYELVGYNLELLEEVARNVETLYLVPAQRDGRAFEYARSATAYFPGIDALQEASRETPRETERADWLRRFSSLYDPGATLSSREPDERPELEIIHTQGPQDELRAAALRALALTTDDGPEPVSPADVLLVARTLDPYLPFLESTFEDLGLPFTTTARAPLRRDPHAGAFLRYVRALAGGLERLAVFGLLRSTRLRLDESRPSAEVVDAWDRRTRAARVHGGIEAWRSLLETPAHSKQEHEASVAPLVKILERLERRRLSWEDASNPRDHLEFLRELAREVLEPSEVVPGGPSALDLLLEGIEAFVDATSAGSARKVAWTPSDCLRLVEQIAEERHLPLGSSGPGGHRAGVRIVDLMQARGVSCRVLIWLGFHDGLFPRRSRVDAYLPDGARQILRDSTGRPLGIRANATDEERLLLAMTLGCARQRVVISFQRADNAGRTQARSSALREVARLFLGRADVSALLDESLGAEFTPTRIPAHPGDRARALVSSPRFSLLPPEQAIMATSLGAREASRAGREAIDRLATVKALESSARVWFRSSLDWVDVLEAYDVSEGPADGVTRIGALSDRPIFATPFERLLRCPLAYFQRYVLGVRRLEDEPRLDQFDENVLGNAVHASLETLYHELADADFFRKVRGKTPELVDQKVQGAITRLEEILGDQLDAAIGPSRLRLRGLVFLLRQRWMRVLRRVARRDLEELIAENAEDLQLEGEVRASLRFPGLGSQEQLEVSLAGRIDRLWCSASSVYIDDFKSSGDLNNKLRGSSILKGQDIQLPLYRELIATSGDDAASARELRARLVGVGPSNEGEPHELKSDDRLRTGFLESLGVAARLLAEGRFPFREDPRQCGYCEFRRTCRRSHEPSVERRESDPTLRDYRDLSRKSSKGRYLLCEVRQQGDDGS